MLGESLQAVRENKEIFIKVSKDIGLEVNSEKTTYNKIGNLSIENVEKFKDVGVTVTNTNDIHD